ncbi:GMC oxidoreductase-domain-containing protein [Mycena sp. CBHHK59/15]|nr:GMC oxidoreductase-domain-containing protein [Mycena sp. CBHHK59/15]
MGIPVMFEVPVQHSINKLRTNIFGAILEVMKYLVYGTGILSIPFMQTSIFAPSLLNEQMETVSLPADLDARDSKNIPDIEIMPIAHRGTEGVHDKIDYIGVFTLLAALLKPKSSGTVRLASADPHTRAQIDLAYLSGDLVVPESEDDAGVDKFVRERVRTTYHYASTCRMAPEDDHEPGVVDNYLQVHGVDGLRVCDCPIFPDIVATHPMAAAVAVAEKCADMNKNAYGNS